MDKMSAHVRVEVFDNGKYLLEKNLVTPSGGELDSKLLEISQARSWPASKSVSSHISQLARQSVCKSVSLQMSPICILIEI